DLVLGPPVFDRHVFALDIAGIFESLAECAQTVRVVVRRCGIEPPDHRHRWLLRARCQWPRRRRPAEQRHELAPLHSITSWTRACTVPGTVRPSALAVLRLTTKSNLVGCWTGRLAGFSPLRIRST